MRNRNVLGIVALVLLLAIAEAGIRLSGLVDFPLYSVDPDIGYIPKEHQSGLFLGQNDWHFNNKSMPIPRDWDGALGPNILLIGNSIVMGGNPYRQQDKVAPILQALLGDSCVVWPIAAGGWTEVNEMVYLDRHPEVLAGADYFAWEYMAGGLSRATPWGGEYGFPTRKPAYATWYVLRRYLLPRIFARIQVSELPATGEPAREHAERFDATIRALALDSGRPRAGFIWLFPKAAQLESARRGQEWLPERRLVQDIADRHGVRIVDVAEAPEWRRELYREDGVHPTVEGNRVLASILRNEVLKDLK